MKNATPKEIKLVDYTPPDFLIDAVDLAFELGEEFTTVQSRLAIRRNSAADAPLVLDGERLELCSILMDGESLGSDDYQLSETTLTIPTQRDSFLLEIETRIRPQDNTSLEGLYQSSGNFCTQCEAEGFRKITYYLDRPDVMATFTTKIVADQVKYPVLLSNGNLVAQGVFQDGRHWVQWHDPYPKPCYLFALVAGKLLYKQDAYVTSSGREVDLRIYVEPENVDKCQHAMDSLKRSMKWDEDTFGLEYDLDIYMIVAVNDFNMGAMENKGLNVFNSQYVLARPETATDVDYEGIEGVIGHEYFHNWTGNRVTCRDWFQLSLKEGLTVFRDQEFSSDMNSRAVKRINDVRILRTAQFAEDAGPMAHPVRPDSYIEINNFYTVTVYNKGAEVIRMMHTLLGPDHFRDGMDLYFQRHDGAAVTCDDFVAAMADASCRDLSQFKRWYSQSGTPVLRVRGDYNAQDQNYTLTVQQSCPPTPGQPDKAPFHLPFAVGLLDSQGQSLPLQLAEEQFALTDETRVLDVRDSEQTFTFVNLPEPPVPSLLRGFSAPVRLDYDYSPQELIFLMAHDPDSFNRWEASQTLAIQTIMHNADRYRQNKPMQISDEYIDAFRRVLEQGSTDKALVAEAITLPSIAYLSELIPYQDVLSFVDVDALFAARQHLRQHIAVNLQPSLMRVFKSNQDTGGYVFDAEACGRRSLKNSCLGYLAETGDSAMIQTCFDQCIDGTNMTDVMAALTILSNVECPQRQTALDAFYARWRDDALVLDKWFRVQAMSQLPQTVEVVKGLVQHVDFHITNPNRVRAVIGAFGHGNPLRFHDASGVGYQFLADHIIQLNDINPQVAARMLGAMTRWRRYDEPRQALMKAQLQRIAEAPGLSNDVFEIASKSLS